MSVIQFDIEKERVYLWMLLFVLLFSLFLHPFYTKAASRIKTTTERSLEVEKEQLQRILQEKPVLKRTIELLSLAMLMALFLGIFSTARCISLRLKGKPLLKSQRRGPPFKIDWTIGDIFRVLIIFLFWVRLFQLIELWFTMLVGPYQIDKNVKMIMGTACMDMLILGIIIYFVVIKYKQKIANLGLSLRRFSKNIWLGLSGYVTFLPFLVFLFLLVVWIADLVDFKPQPQPIFDILVGEKRKALLYISMLLTVLIAPIIEEVFFRGFTYSALKKRLGRLGAIILTSAFFAGLHANVVGFLPIAALGVLLAYLYEKTGSLIPSITVHIIHNSLIASIVLLSREIAG